MRNGPSAITLSRCAGLFFAARRCSFRPWGWPSWLQPLAALTSRRRTSGWACHPRPGRQAPSSTCRPAGSELAARSSSGSAGGQGTARGAGSSGASGRTAGDASRDGSGCHPALRAGFSWTREEGAGRRSLASGFRAAPPQAGSRSLPRAPGRACAGRRPRCVRAGRFEFAAAAFDRVARCACPGTAAAGGCGRPGGECFRWP